VRRMIVTTFFPHAADPQRAVFVRNLARALRRHGELGVVSPSPWAPLLGRLARWRRLGWRFEDGEMDGLSVRRPRYLAVPGLQVLSGITYALALWRRLRRADVERDGLLLHAHCAFPDGVGVALAASWLGLPYVITAHGSDINVYASKALLRPQIRWALRGARGLIAVSGPLLERVRVLASPTPPRLAHIPCAGFDPAAFGAEPREAARRALRLPPSGRVALFVGNLVAVKGADVLLDAWERLAARGGLGLEDRLVIVGDGRERPRLEERAEARGLAPRISFAGAVPFAQVPRWMSASDVLCVPSRSEGTPNVVIEALASGRPVVASRVGGVPEVVRHGENGLLVPPEYPVALAEALASALGRAWDPVTLRASVAHLTWDRLAEADQGFVEGCLSEIQG
jgi:glycosyltransferase involved in cell wall biosynthesis